MKLPPREKLIILFQVCPTGVKCNISKYNRVLQEYEMEHRKGFTRFELLVVFIIVLFLFITLYFLIPPGKKLAKKVQCASQLQGIAHGLHMYHCDYGCQNPIPWNKTKVTKAGFGTGWYNAKGSNTYTRWYDTEWKGWDNQPTVGGCLFLLVKYEDVAPKAFVCPSDMKGEEMDLQYSMALNPKIKDWSDLNDFQSGYNLSYSMNDPWGNPLNASSSSDIPFLADQSNKFDTETFSERPHTGSGPNYKSTSYWTDEGDKSGSDEGHGNSNNHKTVCQNVLFMGEYVKDFQTPTVGIDGDNIYTRWDESVSPVDTQIGKWGKGIFSADRKDAYLGN